MKIFCVALLETIILPHFSPENLSPFMLHVASGPHTVPTLIFHSSDIYCFLIGSLVEYFLLLFTGPIVHLSHQTA